MSASLASQLQIAQSLVASRIAREVDGDNFVLLISMMAGRASLLACTPKPIEEFENLDSTVVVVLMGFG